MINLPRMNLDMTEIETGRRGIAARTGARDVKGDGRAVHTKTGTDSSTLTIMR